MKKTKLPEDLVRSVDAAEAEFRINVRGTRTDPATGNLRAAQVLGLYMIRRKYPCLFVLIWVIGS